MKPRRLSNDWEAGNKRPGVWVNVTKSELEDLDNEALIQAMKEFNSQGPPLLEGPIAQELDRQVILEHLTFDSISRISEIHGMQAAITTVTLKLDVATYLDMLFALQARERQLAERIEFFSTDVNEPIVVAEYRQELLRIEDARSSFQEAFRSGPVEIVELDEVNALPPMEEVETDSPETELHGTEDN